MGAKFQIVDEESDVQGHSAPNEPGIDVDRIKLVTGNGEEITLEPEEGDRFKVVSGSDDVEGHLLKVMPFLIAPRRPRR